MSPQRLISASQKPWKRSTGMGVASTPKLRKEATISSRPKTVLPSSVRLKVEQIQLVSGGWRFGLGSIGLQGA